MEICVKEMREKYLSIPGNFSLVEGSDPHRHLDCLVLRHLLLLLAAN